MLHLARSLDWPVHWRRCAGKLMEQSNLKSLEFIPTVPLSPSLYFVFLYLSHGYTWMNSLY